MIDNEQLDDKPEMETVTYTRKRGRKPINPDLPREVIEYDLPEDEKTCPCCQGELHRIGVETSEQLDIIPKQVKVLRHERKKYVCRHCENHGEGSKIITATMPRQPIPGSISTAGTLATVAVSKYADGLPLYRIEKEQARVGVDIQRTTLANWMIKTATLLSPIYQATHKALLKERVVHGDETTLQVLKEPNRKAQTKSYLWAYSSPEQSQTSVVLFEYQPGRAHTYPKEFGTIMTDGYAAWRMLEKAASQLLPESLMGKAVSYTLKQWGYLERYVEDGGYPIDNNRVERDIRPVATGRKAWMFADTQSGANATLFSIMLSCRTNGVDLTPICVTS